MTPGHVGSDNEIHRLSVRSVKFLTYQSEKGLGFATSPCGSQAYRFQDKGRVLVRLRLFFQPCFLSPLD